jgi:hypothetical protein
MVVGKKENIYIKKWWLRKERKKNKRIKAAGLPENI